MIDAVNEHLQSETKQRPPFILKLEASRDYLNYEAKIQERKLHFAIINPYQAILAEKSGNYRIFGKMGNDDRLRGIIVVRKDSEIDELADLRGKKIGLPAPTALAASMMIKVHLKRMGLDIEKNSQVTYVNSQDSAVMNVYMGLTHAGGTWPPTWDAMKHERSQVTDALKVLTRTEALPNLALVARNDVPDEHVRKISQVLFRLHESIEGQEILKAMEIPKYQSADSRTYEPVRKFLKEYEQLFEKLPLLPMQSLERAPKRDDVKGAP